MKTFFRTLLFIFILLAAVLAFLLTPMGLRMSVALTAKLLPGTLTYQKISGVIIGPIHIEKLTYEDQSQRIAIQSLHFNWQPEALLKKQFHISTLQINGLHIINKNISVQWNIDNIKKIIHGVQTAISFSHIQIHRVIIKNIDFDDEVNKQSFHFSTVTVHSAPSQQKWDTTFFAILKKPQSMSIAMQLQGDLDHYALRISATGHHTNWLLIGDGNQNTIKFTTPNAQFLNGTLKTQFQMTLLPQWQWHGDISANQIDFSTLNPNWEKSFNLLVTSTGKQTSPHTTPIFSVTAKSRLNQHKQKIEIKLAGTVKQQSFNAHIRLHHSAIDFHAVGNFTQKHEWTGTLDQFNLWIKHAATWRLQKPVSLSIASDHAVFSPLCLQSSQAGLTCIQGKWANRKIDATAEWDITHFQWLRAFTRFVNIPQGNFKANLQITGAINDPSINGTLQLVQGSLVFPRLNITLNNVHASLTGNHHSLNFDAKAFSQHQPITATGIINFDATHFQVKGDVAANNALIIDTGEYTVYTTSRLNIVINNQSVDITGHILIPHAVAHHNDYHATVSLPTSDIVYLGNITPPPKLFWNVSTDVLITLGNDVRIDNISGFNAQLIGNLRLQQSNNSDLLGTGQIFAHHGVYHVLAQTLTVSPNSSVEYLNTPLNNPRLNITASKQIQSLNSTESNFMQNNLMVGITLQGTVHSPKFSFFSNHGNLTQADIVSYILLGYDTSTSPVPGNADILLRALSAVNLTSQGLLGKQNIATQIQSGLGLNELGVESESTVDAIGNTLDRQSAFVVGKHFTRRLYARYSIGILNPVNVFELRYLINRQWAIQTDSSTLGNGADVVYTITKD